MFLEPQLEVLVGRRVGIDTVFEQELELLPEPPPNDGVVPIEPHGDRLADRHLFADVVADQPLELLARGRPEPDELEALGEVLDLAAGDHDAALSPSAASPLEKQE